MHFCEFEFHVAIINWYEYSSLRARFNKDLLRRADAS
jgi:hypothetical protein